MEQEVISNKLIQQGWDIYEEFIDKMIRKSRLRWLWNFIKKAKVKYFQ